MDDAERFIVGQKAVIERDGRILVLNDPKRGLDFPGGKIQVGEENLRESLKREIIEETTLEVEVLEPLDVGFWNKTRPTYFVFFKATYISGEVKLSSEHDNFEWIDKGKIASFDNEHSFYRILEKYFQGA